MSVAGARAQGRGGGVQGEQGVAKGLRMAGPQARP